jgi:hypothetical protein
MQVVRSVVFRGGQIAREDIEQYEGIVSPPLPSYSLNHSLHPSPLPGLLRLPRHEHAHHQHPLLERGPGDGAHVLLRGGHPRVRAAAHAGRRAPLAAGDERRGGARGGAHARADTRAGEGGHHRLNFGRSEARNGLGCTCM